MVVESRKESRLEGPTLTPTQPKWPVGTSVAVIDALWVLKSVTPSVALPLENATVVPPAHGAPW